MRINLNKPFKIILIIIIILSVVELALRHYLGFCDSVLMQEDPKFEYISCPNQDRIRFGNHIKYNNFSMRSEEIDTSANIILGFGDSIFNGGVFIDQDSLASTILSKKISITNKHKVQFLNISAGSWGPDNCFAYLMKYGNFGCKEIYLIVSSHDAYDNMTFDKVVGVNFRYPKKQYSLAIIELLDRYIIPETKKLFGMNIYNIEESDIDKRTLNTGFNNGFDSFLKYSNLNNLPLTIYLHASKNEIINGKYNEQGNEIINFAMKNNIKILKDLEMGIKGSDLHDKIHYNNSGQRKMAEIIFKSYHNDFLPLK